MKTAIAIVILSVAFAVGAVVFVMVKESEKNADPNRVITQVDPPPDPDNPRNPATD